MIHRLTLKCIGGRENVNYKRTLIRSENDKSMLTHIISTCLSSIFKKISMHSKIKKVKKKIDFEKKNYRVRKEERAKRIET